MEGALVCLSCGYLSKGIHFLCSYFRIGGASIIAHTAHQINEEIHDKEVRLISAQGEQLGIMPLAEGHGQGRATPTWRPGEDFSQ